MDRDGKIVDLVGSEHRPLPEEVHAQDE